MTPRVLSAQIVLNSADRSVIDALRQKWQHAGFEVGPEGPSGFAITAPVAHFERFFGLQPLDPSQFVNQGLPLHGLDPALQKGVSQILFTRVDFGLFP